MGIKRAINDDHRHLLEPTFQKEILGKATAANDNGVKVKLGDNNHQGNNDHYNNDNRDGEGFARSVGGALSGAMAELSLPTLLPTIAKCQHNATTAVTAMEESVRQDRGRSSSYNADYI
jgi:hypothetical protein